MQDQRAPESNGLHPHQHYQQSPQQVEVSKHRNPNTINVSTSVLYNIASTDDEGQSRQRVLAFAAKRYASAVERNSEDYDALYNWALVLQESADNIDQESSPSVKDQILEEACNKYEESTRLCPTLHEAFYNWAIAISDRAKNRGRTREAEELWKQACTRYERSVQLNWNNPQALNNWGLALQELSGIVPTKDKQSIVKAAIKKFRRAIQLQFDFHRAIYNLGTVLYGLAEDIHRLPRSNAVDNETPPDLYSQSAIYIAAAHALKSDYPVYRSALRLVHSMLPLPYMKTGYLTVAPGGNSLIPHGDWKRILFVLDHEAFYEIETTAATPNETVPGGYSKNLLPLMDTRGNAPITLRIELNEIINLLPSADLTLPSGKAFCIDTTSGEKYLLADNWEEVDSWLDAIRLAYTVYFRGNSEVLAGVLAS